MGILVNPPIAAAMSLCPSSRRVRGGREGHVKEGQSHSTLAAPESVPPSGSAPCALSPSPGQGQQGTGDSLGTQHTPST